MEKSVVYYLPEGFADWEGAFLLPELRDNKIPVIITSDNGEAVYSIGGLKTQVERAITSITPEETKALILIGSDSWPDANKNKSVLNLAVDFHKLGILVAGICGATAALARTGIYSDKKHTSNDLGWLKHVVPNYKDEKNYVEKLVVTDGNLITAAGIGPVDFTFEVMTFLNIYSDKKRKQWYEMFKHGVKPPMDFWS